MMTEQQVPDFSIEERLNQAAGNWNALFFAVVDYLREQGMPPESFIQWLGERFAPGWEECRGDMQQIAYYAALNPVSLGSELRRYEVGENEATVQTTIGHLSDKGEDVDLLAEIYGPIMDFLDLDYEWERQGEGEAAVTSLRMYQRGAP
jgi:hypothetical protein